MVNTITNAIRKSFDTTGNANYVRDHYPYSNRRETNIDNYSNDIDEGYDSYGYPLDFYDYEEDSNYKMPYASNSPQSYQTLERLRDLKNIYKPPKRRKLPTYKKNTRRRKSYEPRRNQIKYYK